MRARAMFVVVLLALICAGVATASTTSQLHRRARTQRQIISHDHGALRFCKAHHPARKFCTMRHKKFWRAQIRWTRRELGETLLILRVRSRPKPVPVSYGAPSWFVQQALCVHSHEGSWTDTGDPFWGGMQFMLGTWERAGGSGYPSDASPEEQIYRAYVIYRSDGNSWQEWPNTSRMCGL